MDADDRAAKAASIFQAAPKDSAARAVAYFTGRWGRDEMPSARALTQHINQAAGTPTLEQQMAQVANKPAAPLPWYKRIMGVQP